MDLNAIWVPLSLSLRVAGLATLIALLAGVSIATLLANWRHPLNPLLDTLFNLPLVLPPTVLGYYLLVVWGGESPLGAWLEAIGIPLVFTWRGAVLASSLVALPLVVQSSRAALEGVDPKLQDVARTLGRSEFSIFFTVSLPLARRGILAGGVLALARALAIQPDLLLMDEPFAAVEETLRIHLRKQLQRLQLRFKIPVLLVTHSLEEAYLLADQLLVLERGRIVQSGPRDAVFRQPSTPSVARLMGMSNIFHGTMEGQDAEQCTVKCDGLRFKLRCRERVAQGERVQIGIRPEDVLVIREGRSLDPAIEENVLDGVVIEDQALGFDHLVAIALKGKERDTLRIQARIPHPVFLRLALRPGNLRQISVRPENIRLFPPQGAPGAHREGNASGPPS